MKTFVKPFSALTPDELYEILRARGTVFLHEQHIHYLDMDGTDRQALHVFMRDGEAVVAYARIFPGDAEGEVHMGRVLTTRRGEGLGRKVVEAALEAAFGEMKARFASLDSQSYVAEFYRHLGFRQVSDEFVLEGIPHVRMEMEKGESVS